MITYHDHTLRLLGVPVFTLAVGAVLITALALLVVGLFRRGRPSGKAMIAAGALVLLLAALATVLVLLTVEGGGMR